jgi:hypothetical protein
MRENVMPRQLSHSASTSSVCMQGSDPRAIRGREQMAVSANHQMAISSGRHLRERREDECAGLELEESLQQPIEHEQLTDPN